MVSSVRSFATVCLFLSSTVALKIGDFDLSIKPRYLHSRVAKVEAYQLEERQVNATVQSVTEQVCAANPQNPYLDCLSTLSTYILTSQSDWCNRKLSALQFCQSSYTADLQVSECADEQQSYDSCEPYTLGVYQYCYGYGFTTVESIYDCASVQLSISPPATPASPGDALPSSSSSAATSATASASGSATASGTPPSPTGGVPGSGNPAPGGSGTGSGPGVAPGSGGVVPGGSNGAPPPAASGTSSSLAPLSTSSGRPAACLRKLKVRRLGAH